MTQIEMWAQNIIFLIGALICLAVSGVLGVAAWIGLKVLIFRRRQRVAFEEYRRRSRRADGKPYPPRIGGVCGQCGRVKGVVYHLADGRMLCHDCYEAWWPQDERAGPSGSPDVAVTPPPPRGGGS